MNSHLKYYRINNLFIDKNLPQLICENGQVQGLEQKVWQLILLFCRKPQQIVTRDEIIESVYHGTIVSDNAVNKLVAKVRKTLGDTPANAKYIKTVPKQGYSLIASCAELESIGSQASEDKTERNIFVPIGVIVATVIVFAFLKLILTQSNEQQYINKKLSPLTRSVGVESSPYLSNDGRYLIYQKNSPQQGLEGWWLSEISNAGAERSLPILNDRSPIAWLPERHSFLYAERDESNCEVRQMDVTSDSINSSLVMNCGEFWLSQLVSTADGTGFYFVARKQVDEPWLVYFYSFAEKESMAIQQPSASGYGNYAIDLSSSAQKLLILSSTLEGKTSFHVLNLSSNELKKVGQRDWMLSRAIWHHDDTRILHTSQRYARELLLTDFKGDTVSTLISTSKRVSDNFKRHPNGVDYYFTSFQMNNDLLSYRNGRTIENLPVNTEVYEKLPAFNGLGETWYFVSNRQGISQIFLATDNGAKQISNFNTEHNFTGLQSSISGEMLAFYDAKYMYVYQTKTGVLEQYETPRGVIAAFSWLDNDAIAVSTSENGATQAHTFNLTEKAFNSLDSRWQAIFSAPDSDQTYAIEFRTNKIFRVDEQYEVIKELELTIDYPISFNGLQIKATQSSLVYAKSQGMRTSIYQYNLDTGIEQKLGEWLFIVGFDVRGQELILSYEKDRTGDVMLTNLVAID